MSDSSAYLAYLDIYGIHVDDLSRLRVLDEAGIRRPLIPLKVYAATPRQAAAAS